MNTIAFLFEKIYCQFRFTKISKHGFVVNDQPFQSLEK